MTPEENKSEENIKQKLARIEKGLKDAQTAFMSIKKLGIHREILIAYLHDKTGFGKRDIVQFIWAQEEFYRKLQQIAEPPVKK